MFEFHRHGRNISFTLERASYLILCNGRSFCGRKRLCGLTRSLSESEPVLGFLYQKNFGSFDFDHNLTLLKRTLQWPKVSLVSSLPHEDQTFNAIVGEQTTF